MFAFIRYLEDYELDIGRETETLNKSNSCFRLYFMDFHDIFGFDSFLELVVRAPEDGS